MYRLDTKGYRLLLIALLVFAHPCARAQIDNVRFEHLTINDGLSQSPVNALLEDRQGFLWVGTRMRGLWLFDRESASFGAVPVIPRLKVNKLFEGPDGVLWIGIDERGLLWYWPDSGAVVEADPDGSDQVYTITATQAGEIWVSGDSGIVSRYRSDRSRIAEFSARPPTGIQNYEVRSMIQDNDSRIWIGSFVAAP